MKHKTIRNENIKTFLPVKQAEDVIILSNSD